MKKIFLISLGLMLITAHAQVDSTGIVSQPKSDSELNLNTLKTYKLGGLEITGGVPYTSKQILRFIGLNIGDEIEIPGPTINNALKRLWEQNLFSDVELFADKVVGDSIFLRFNLTELPTINEVSFQGVKKGKQSDFIKENKLTKGKKITQDLLNQARINIRNFYTEKGYPDAQVDFEEIDLQNSRLGKNLLVKVSRGERVKVQNIVFEGNKSISAAKLRRKGLENTVRKNFFRRSILKFFKGSKYIPEKFQEDLTKLKDVYKSEGFRDVKITYDSVKRIDAKNYLIKIGIDEGERYYLGNITFVGNSVYPTETLKRIFSYKKGAPYDAVGINKKLNDPQKDDNILTLYQDNGYLFSRVIPIEKSVVNDTINLEVRIVEGEQATWDRVTFSGNTQTHDHVIVRELSTVPGELFSKSDIRRTMMKLGALGFFEPNQIKPDIKDNQETNTVDINWELAPKSSSQVELKGGYGGGRFIGTVGLTFGNFSIKNLFNKKAWRPVPLGDGQQLSLRAQAGSYYSNFSLSFTEPWIGGSRPTALSLSVYNSNYQNIYRLEGEEDSRLTIWGATVGLNKLLTWPDDYFRLNQSITYQRYDFTNYQFNLGSRSYSNGVSNTVAYNIGLSRLSAGPDPIFPQEGSDFSVNVKLTPPYSLFNKNKDYEQLKKDGDFEGLYKWLEYYKIQFSGNFYKQLVGKLVLRTGAEFGYLGAYNNKVGISPFERFYMGGTGLQANRFDGRDIVTLRGYSDFTNTGGQAKDITPLGGGVIYDKFLLEMRYPITMNQQAKIFGLGFLEAGNTWGDHKDFRPFELKRSAGLGIRVFMSAFGMLGFDFGYGFDKYQNTGEPSGWQTHFIFGQQL
uniref:outer membrane protein assembly factor BamA n=1 Tax=Ornithobacterium rhinotracheale TaxID=28251 RepID=UPI0039A49236